MDPLIVIFIVVFVGVVDISPKLGFWLVLNMCCILS
jgi:hypothetical protein